MTAVYAIKLSVIGGYVVAMMKDTVIGSDPSVVYIATDFVFRYTNGSKCYVGGMKDETQREAIRSIGQKGGVGIAFMEEGTQFTEQDYDELIGRLRDPTAPWTQIIIATNPDRPLHWINVRLIKGGEASVHYSSAHDNPHNPEQYIRNLGRMRGLQGARLRDGLWIEGVGLVIDRWSDDYSPNQECYGNVLDDADYIPGFGQVVLAADDGYAGEYDDLTGTFSATSHPRVFLLAQLRNDGRIAVFAEHYRIKTLHPQHITQLKDYCKLNNWPFPRLAVYDKASATLGGALSKAGMKVYKGPADVEETVKLFNQQYVAPDENEVRGFIVHPRCRHLRLEMGSYSRDTSGNIIKAHDNGPDAARYLTDLYHQKRLNAPDVAVAGDVDMDEIDRMLDEVFKKYELESV